jgi:hypothetical protein
MTRRWRSGRKGSKAWSPSSVLSCLMCSDSAPQGAGVCLVRMTMSMDAMSELWQSHNLGKIRA